MGNLGVFPVLAVVSAAKGVVESNPKLKEFKEKYLDKLSVGKQVTNLITGGKDEYEKSYFEQYKTLAGRHEGHEYDPKFLTTALVDLFRMPRSTFPPIRSGKYGKWDDEKFFADVASQVAAAIKAGQVSGDDTAQSIFTRIIKPWMAPMGPFEPAGDWSNWMQRGIIDTIDNYLYGMPVTWSEAQGSPPKSSYPKLVDVLNSLPSAAPTATPQPAAAPSPVVNTPVATLPAPTPGPTPPPVSVPPPAPSPGPAVATVTPPPNIVVNVPPLPANPTTDNVNDMVQLMLKQGADQQQAYLAALNALQSRGVPVTTQVKEVVAQQAGLSAPAPDWMKYLAIGLGAVGLVFALAAPAGRGRR